MVYTNEQQHTIDIELHNTYDKNRLISYLRARRELQYQLRYIEVTFFWLSQSDDNESTF